MEEKRSSSRSKRQSKSAPDEGFWDCSVCTYKNSPEAYKCEMCDVRKGTSTRKPRLNSQLVAQQVAQQFAPPAPPKKEKSHNPAKKEKLGSHSKDGNRPPRLRNIDRSSAQHIPVTVNNVTVIITDYQPKMNGHISSSENTNHSSDASSDTNSSSTSHDANDEDSPTENGNN
ncbi:YY1-associated factor 2-like [Haliotis rubra]|uniref:YY1-associated factor 2-like n=1 Tax=Haliotis rufescens TaxID=6454 RepID=UPI001EB06D01|nr:YY1-associated factor 2-like [Haliotis rufescens]XP_046548754.1 YY1-associated factor 2-like [Haliotis rubra]XP_046548755.1 YY1-associated factor 2-like [Haliotis rubra]XP_046548756.1 YY1-associated factor 2-like [Haliotis rubra]